MKAIIASLGLTAAASAIDVTPFIDVFTTRVTHTDGLEFNELTRGEVDYTQSSTNLILGYVGGKDTPWNWIPMLNYKYSSLDIDTLIGPPSPTLDDDLHELTLPNLLVYNQNGSRWFHGMYNSFGLRSDFDHIDSRDFFLSAAIGSGYQFNDCFILAVGIYGSNLTNDPWFVPAPVFVWMPTEDWLISYYGPKFVARREFGPNIRFGFEGAWNGGSWNVETNPAFTDSVRADLSSIRAGLYYKQRIYKEFWIDVGAGFTFANELTIYSNGGRDLLPTSFGEMDSAPYVTLGLSVNRW